MRFAKLALVTMVTGKVSIAAASGDDIGSCASFPKEEASFGEHAMLQQSSGAARAVSFGLHRNVENGVHPTNVEEFVTSCEAITPEVKAALAKEIKEYEADFRFQTKIKEAKGEISATAGHKSIVKYLSANILEPDWSILELGCAAGGMLRYVGDAYAKHKIGSHGSLVGVELVTGWVEFAKEYYPSEKRNIDVYEGDITDFSLPAPYKGKTFDFVMLNDVMEHIQKKRYGCFFSQLDKVTHDGSLVYMHTPSPKAQLLDKDQYYENVVPHNLVVSGMAMIGFELVQFEYDKDTQCGGAQDKHLPKQLKGAGCYFNGWPKYTHNVYRKTEDKGVLNVS